MSKISTCCKTEIPFKKQLSYIAMEYCPNGDLFSLIKQTGPLEEPLCRHYFKQILNSVGYLHEEGKVAHLDIKLENVLIDSSLNLKLCDLAFAEGFSNKIYKK